MVVRISYLAAVRKWSLAQEPANVVPQFPAVESHADLLKLILARL